VAQRIEVGSAINRSAMDVVFIGTNGRFKRYGQLPLPPGANGRQVRCACKRCGAHLYAMPVDSGGLNGVCVVCGGAEVKPVD
jgi:hypothetical protein